MAESEQEPKKIIKRLRYPLHNDDEYKAKIIFTLVKEKEITAEAISEAFGSFGTGLLDAANNFIEENLGGVSRENLEKQNAEHEGASNQSASKPTRSVPDTKVTMYLPTALSFRDNVTYENFDLGGVGAAFEGGSGKVAAALSEGVSSIANILQGSSTAPVGDVAKLAAVKAAGLKGKFLPFGEERARVAQGALRVASNPNTRVFFKQVNIREFAFTFKMIARSAEEAAQVKEIVKFFRTELYPSDIEVAGVSLGYNFPNKFRIQFQYDGKPIAHKLKDCFLRDVSVTYNPSGMSMHPDGEFLEVDMSLAFQENRALTRKDVEEDGF